MVTTEGITLFSEKALPNEPFHLNSPLARDYSIFHINGSERFFVFAFSFQCVVHKF